MSQLGAMNSAQWFHRGEEKWHFGFGMGVLKIKYLLYRLSNRYLYIICSMFDSYFTLLFIYKGVLWFVIYRKSIHGNKLNLIAISAYFRKRKDNRWLLICLILIIADIINIIKQIYLDGIIEKWRTFEYIFSFYVIFFS